MADVKLKITFIDMDVHSDGDKIGKGKLYWSFKVDGAVVSSRSVGNPLIIGSGGTVSLGTSRTVTKSGAIGSELTVNGTLSEYDSLDRDESDSFQHNYTAADSWGTGLRQANFSDGPLNVTLNYIIARV
jgi:hypothetical protein